MKVTVILIVIGAFGTVIKGLVQRQENLEIRGWVKIIQIAEIGQNTEKTPCHSDSSKIIMIIIIIMILDKQF